MNIQWNKVTWYSKTLALVLFVAMPICAFYYGETYGKAVEVASQPIPPSAPTVPAAALPAYYSSPAEWQADAESTGGFSIAYPKDFDAQDQASASAAQSTGWSMDTGSGELGAVYFTLTVPRDFDPQTNFAGAKLTVGASASPAAVSGCTTPSSSSGIQSTSAAAINGVPFTVFNSSDAGAGNYYQTTSYRAVHKGKCYAVEYTVHSSQIANYPASYGLQPFDEAEVAHLMENIVRTFKFQ